MEGRLLRVCSDGRRGNGFKLKEGGFGLDIRMKFFTLRLVKHWNRLSREIVDASSLEAIKASLDTALSNSVKDTPAHSRGLGLDDC